MFDPDKQKLAKKAKQQAKKAITDLSLWANLLVPAALQDGLLLDVKEVQCGDPGCAPVDTVFTLVWQSGGRGVFALPFSPEEIQTQDELAEMFPDEETLTLWKSGKRAPWPRRPELRFGLDDRVECRVGPHPVKGWVAGKIIKLHYTEPSWPPNMVAPYQIALHDGRLIFAPQDTNAVIRLRRRAGEMPAPDAPSSPEYPVAGADDDFEEDGEYDFDDDDGEEGEGEEEEDDDGIDDVDGGR